MNCLQTIFCFLSIILYAKIGYAKWRFENALDCQIILTESIPEHLTYLHHDTPHPSTYHVWSSILGVVKTELKIASFYWNLLAKAKYNISASIEGRNIFRILENVTKRANVQITNNNTTKGFEELDMLTKEGAKVKYVNFPHLIKNGGVLHTKLLLADDAYGYLGSANMDWLSLTEVKELGIALVNCPEIIEDLKKIWTVYWLVGGVNQTIPSSWPPDLSTKYNLTNPMKVNVNGKPTNLYISSSPPEFNPSGRTNDLDSILSVIKNAKKFIFIAVMDYIPEVDIYIKKVKFWPVIDNALRSAAIDRSVEVRLLISKWSHSSYSMVHYLKSLHDLNEISKTKLRVRRFVVPTVTPIEKLIPFSRVNHNKYMVTDSDVYIGTSNWSGDYFVHTGGASIVLQENLADPLSLRQQTVDIFLRDWNSEHAFEL